MQFTDLLKMPTICYCHLLLEHFVEFRGSYKLIRHHYFPILLKLGFLPKYIILLRVFSSDSKSPLAFFIEHSITILQGRLLNFRVEYRSLEMLITPEYLFVSMLGTWTIVLDLWFMIELDACLFLGSVCIHLSYFIICKWN